MSLRRGPDTDKRAIDGEVAQPVNGLPPGGLPPLRPAVRREVDANHLAARILQAERAGQPEITKTDHRNRHNPPPSPHSSLSSACYNDPVSDLSDFPARIDAERAAD